MKKTIKWLSISLIIALVAAFTVMLAFAAENTTEFAGGEGTAASPYLISTKEQLNNVRNYLSAHFKMTADIVFTDEDFAEGGTFYNGGAGFTPIGNKENPFTGTFDGNGHTISGLYINISATSTAYGGLFGYASGAMIKNLGMVDSNITVTTTSGTAYAGGIAGYAYTNTAVSDCYNTGAVSADDRAGGIVGYAYTNTAVSDCYNTGAVSAYDRAGGIVGQTSSSTITNSYNTGNVIGLYAGGIAGYGGTISNCYNTGCIGGSGCQYAGGITGQGSNISDCRNSGNITAEYAIDADYGEAVYAGGISGSGGNISNCYNSGNITSINTVTGTLAAEYSSAGGISGMGSIITNCGNTGNIYASRWSGGIVGTTNENIFSASFTNCYNTGSVSEGYYSSGIIAYSYASNTTISDCYNTGSVSGKSCSAGIVAQTYSKGNISRCYNTGAVKVTYSSGYVGAIMGASYSDTITDCYYIDNIDKGVDSGTDTCTKCTHAEMKAQSTFEGFDFESVWTMDGNADYLYPELRDVSMAFTKKADKLVITSMPNKTQYIEAIPFDSTGLEITAYYNNGEVEVVDDYDLSGYTASVGTNTITVSHMGATTTFDVIVVEKTLINIEVTTLPSKVVYLEGATFSASGMVVTAYYDNDTNAAVTGYAVSGYTSTPGTKTITVSYEGKSDTFTVTVTPKSLTRIAVTVKPNKLTYNVGEEFDGTGLIVTAYYDNRTSTAVTPESISGYDPTLGIKIITVTFGGYTSTFAVEVAEYKSISMYTYPAKREYLEGKDALEVTGGKIKVTYTNGDYKTVDLTANMISGFDNTIVGVQTLTVTYCGLTTTYTVEIIAKSVSSISVSINPPKLVYQVGEELSIVGGEITLYYDNGTFETVKMTESMVFGFNSSAVGICDVTVTYENCTCTFSVEIVNQTLLTNNWNTVKVASYSLPKDTKVMIAIYSESGQQLDYGVLTWEEGKTLEFVSDKVESSGRIRVFYLDEAGIPVREAKTGETAVCVQHTPQTMSAVESTCEKTGLTEGSQCAVCDKVLVAQQTTPLAAHTPKKMPAVAATCTATGLTEGSQCAVCDKVLKAQQTVPMVEHTWKSATCTSPKTCSVCDETTGVALGHDYHATDETIPCYSTSVCSRCKVVTEREIPENHYITHGNGICKYCNRVVYSISYSAEEKIKSFDDNVARVSFYGATQTDYYGKMWISLTVKSEITFVSVNSYSPTPTIYYSITLYRQDRVEGGFKYTKVDEWFSYITGRKGSVDFEDVEFYITEPGVYLITYEE